MHVLSFFVLRALAKPKRMWLMVLTKYSAAPVTFLIEDDGRTKTTTNDAYSRRILCTVLSGAGVATLTMRGSPLLREKSVKIRPPYT